MSTTSQTVRSLAQHNLLHCHPSHAHHLPHPEEDWLWGSTDIPHKILHRWADAGIIEQAGRVKHGKRHNYWTTPQHIHDYIQQNVPEPTHETPCEHSGINNLGNGEYTCTNPTCDETFGRETAREVIQG